MIDKRINYKYGGGADMGASSSSKSGKTGGGGNARDKGMGMAGKTGNYSAPTSTGGGGGNQFTSVTSGTLSDPREKKDFFTQSYTAPGIFGLGGGYRNLNVPGDTSQGFKQGIGSRILGGILGLINPFLGFGYRALASIPGAVDKFQTSETLEQFRDKLRGYGKTMPTISPNPMFGGIESLAVNPQIISDTSFSPTNQPFNYMFDTNKTKQMIENAKSLPNDIDLQNRINISNQYELPLDYSSDDLRARAVRAMTQPGMRMELAPYEKGVPQELQFFEGRPYTATPYNPYTVDTQQLPGNNLRTEVTKMDLQKFKQPMTQTMDYDTYMSINPGSTLSPYEFEQLKQGKITQPGTYVG